MANVTRELLYRCSDDCQMSGCPGHAGRLDYQSVSDAYKFTMNGRELSFERGELDAMIELLRNLGRADSASPPGEPKTPAAEGGEVSELREELEALKYDYALLANEMVYDGNSIGWIASKAKNYGRAILDAWDAVKAVGGKCDGKTPLHEAIRAQLTPTDSGAGRDGEYQRHPDPVAERVGDMGEGTKLQLFREDDGDFIVSVMPEKHRLPETQVQFCVPGSGGGSSPKTWDALCALHYAMHQDAIAGAAGEGK